MFIFSQVDILFSLGWGGSNQVCWQSKQIATVKSDNINKSREKQSMTLSIERMS